MITAHQIERARTADIAAIVRGLKLRRSGRELVGPCPRCGGRDRFAINIAKQVFNCRGCGARGDAISLLRFLDRVDFRAAVERLADARPAATPERDQARKAAWLWSQRRPIEGSIAARYLRTARGYAGRLPATLGFLPAGKHPAAMIAAFGLCDEAEPGILAQPRHVECVHLTLLKPDGSGKADRKPNKIVIGPVRGRPIVLAPANDLLGLAICEGIEDSLTMHAATGLGAWAAYCAGNMAKLAPLVPSYVETISIVADADPVGQRHAGELARALSARFVHVFSPGAYHETRRPE